MTRDDIINHLGWSEFTDIDSQPDSLFSRIESLARKAEEAEREACAKVCDDMTTGDRVSFDWERGASDCAHAIRARNQPPKNEP